MTMNAQPAADVISLDEWRAGRYSPDEPPPCAPALRLVEQDERPGEPLRLDVFLARARVVLAEVRHDEHQRSLYAVPAS
ncbi:MAG: hypothetical protein QOG33_1725 [Gaiellales bacterium]|jgi:hypothetical protein|nr:hypothetical protein [Gaiellales bacterium]